MIDAQKIGRLVAEALLNEPGPCFYPGKFKPPHKGHFEAAKSLASKEYITKVYVIISSKEIELHPKSLLLFGTCIWMLNQIQKLLLESRLKDLLLSVS